jgi:hypothetical protein
MFGNWGQQRQVFLGGFDGEYAKQNFAKQLANYRAMIEQQERERLRAREDAITLHDQAFLKACGIKWEA